MQTISNDSTGYSIHDRLFDECEMARIRDALSAADIIRSKAGARHVLRVDAVRELAHDRRLIDLATQVIGSAPVPFRATLFDKSPASNWLVAWHQDTALPMRCRVESDDWGPWSTKSDVLYAHAPAWTLERIVAIRVHLDDSTVTNGPLRVLPGTHTRGVLTDSEIERMTTVTAAVDCVTAAGGVVAMRPLTVHASSKSQDGRRRRVLHIEYAADLTLGGGIELAVA
jgi:hypothetical protein